MTASAGIRPTSALRRGGEPSRRTAEIHRGRLYHRGEMADVLERAGFTARVLDSYGDLLMPPGRGGFLGIKVG